MPYLDQAELSTLLAYCLSVIYPVKYLIHVFSAFGPWFAHCKGMGILAWDGAETPIKPIDMFQSGLHCGSAPGILAFLLSVM